MVPGFPTLPYFSLRDSFSQASQTHSFCEALCVLKVYIGVCGAHVTSLSLRILRTALELSDPHVDNWVCEALVLSGMDSGFCAQGLGCLALHQGWLGKGSSTAAWCLLEISGSYRAFSRTLFVCAGTSGWF